MAQTFCSWYLGLFAALIGIPFIQYQTHFDVNLIWQFWIHTECIKKLPWVVEFLFSTPSHHRVHHGRNPYCIDKNYGGVLIIWDRIFGTFAQEREEDAPVYGLVVNVQSFNPWTIQTHYFRYIYDKFWTTKLNGFKYLFYGPGYQKGGPRLGYPEKLPQPEKPVKFYDGIGNSNLLLIAYLVVQTYKANHILGKLIELDAELSGLEIALCGIFMCCIQANFGDIFDGIKVGIFKHLLKDFVYSACGYWFIEDVTIFYFTAVSTLFLLFADKSVLKK